MTDSDRVTPGTAWRDDSVIRHPSLGDNEPTGNGITKLYASLNVNVKFSIQPERNTCPDLSPAHSDSVPDDKMINATK